MTASTASSELQAARRRAGLTLEAIAERLKVDVSTVSRWMRGKQQPDFEQLEALARAMDQPITLTFGGGRRKAAPPEPWVERLLTGVMVLEGRAGITETELDEAEAHAAAYLAVAHRRRRAPRGAGAGGLANA